MIYRDEARRIEGVWNKTQDFTSDRHIIAYADNLADLEKWLQATPRRWNSNESVKNQAEDKWDLKAGWKGAVGMAKDGWSEGAQDLDARLQAIMPSSGRMARYGYSVVGSSPNVGRFLRGNPNNMKRRAKKTFGSSPVFHIVVNGNASCMVRGDQMRNYGTALVGLIDRMENTGRRVHLDVLYALKENDYRVACGWNVKRASEHIDLAAVAFSLAHPAAFRRLGFAMLERTPKAAESYGYGYCADILPVDLPDQDGADSAMLLDGVNHEPGRCNSPEDALRLAIEQLNKAAVIAGHSTPDCPLIDDAEMFAALDH